MKSNTRFWACIERNSVSIHRGTECFEQKFEREKIHTLRLVHCSVGIKGFGIIVRTYSAS